MPAKLVLDCDRGAGIINQESLPMVIISQKAGKHDFIGPLDRNQRKTYEVLTTFMQNKPNFLKDQMNVNPYNTTYYENIYNWTLGENKPNSNPM